MQRTDALAVLPPIPAKRYFTIGEVSELCGVKPHVLRYWEQEFTQLRPVKRRGNRRYYQHHEVLLVRRIRELLYEQGFTINGARNRLDENERSPRAHARANGNGVSFISLARQVRPSKTSNTTPRQYRSLCAGIAPTNFARKASSPDCDNCAMSPGETLSVIPVRALLPGNGTCHSGAMRGNTKNNNSNKGSA